VTWRVAALIGGIAVPLVVVASPVAHLDHHLLTAHMAQHLLLMLVAAPLILLGAPAAALPRPPLAIGWLAGSFTVMFWHIPAIFDLAFESHLWHGFEQVSFVTAGVLFWRPVIGSSGWPGADLSFPGDVALRRPFRISHFLRPRGLSALFVRACRDVRAFSPR
jgi:cytochrome c oxidase assembly factor CtaG